MICTVVERYAARPVLSKSPKTQEFEEAEKFSFLKTFS
jgi:hypothetical protein